MLIHMLVENDDRDDDSCSLSQFDHRLAQLLPREHEYGWRITATGHSDVGHNTEPEDEIKHSDKTSRSSSPRNPGPREVFWLQW